jgi:hypothetical protein
MVAVPPRAPASLTHLSGPAPTTPRPTAPTRLTAVRAALAVGGFAVLTVELLGAVHALTAPALRLTWVGALLTAATVTGWRWRQGRRDGRSPLSAGRALGARMHTAWRTASRPERLMAGALGGLVLAELVVALLAEPNNFDSQTYHLPKVEHWAAQHSLEFWPTAIHRQVTIPPGAEYLLLHLRLLTGGDALYNLVQWAAGIGCLLLASRITAQLGGGRRAQLITAFVVGTTPMVTLQATSTQTDLVVAAWAGCVATLALDGLRRRATLGTVLALGTAVGLTAVTKTSGLLGAGPMLALWAVAQLRLSRGAVPRVGGGPLRAVATSVAVLAVAAVFVGPFLARVTADFGHPLGPPRLRESIPTQRHDPASVLVNGARIAHTALDTPLAPLRGATASAITGMARLIGVDPQDRAITFGRTTFPVTSWYPDEDRVSFPLTGALVVIGGALALVRPRAIAPDRTGTLRAYAAAVATTALLHAATIKWQPWGNRLLLFALILAAPLAGVWLDALLRRRAAAPGRRSVAALAVVAVLTTSALAGALAVSYGFPRRLVGTGSSITSDSWETRFIRRPQWGPEFRWAAASVDASGARRVGLVQQNDNWEYPWWLLLGDRHEIVALQSVLPQRAPADPRSVDAIVCTGDRSACAALVPRGWRMEFRDYVGYALPPAR